MLYPPARMSYRDEDDDDNDNNDNIQDDPPIPATRYVPGLEERLVLHEEWVRSEGIRGCRAVFSGTHFPSDVSFEGYDLRGALFNRVKGYRLFFRGVNLDEAVFRGADLKATFFMGASLIGADFRRAVLTQCYLQDADLRYANLEGWKGQDSSFFTGADLSGANYGEGEAPVHGWYLRSFLDREPPKSARLPDR